VSPRYHTPVPISVLLLAASTTAVAPPLPDPGFSLKTWTTEDGLPSDAVIGLAQTPDGYLWVGTNAGLARFDGVRFEVFDRRTTPELAGDQCAPLAVDRAGALWIGTMGGGLARYAAGKFTGWGRQQGSTYEYATTSLLDGDGGIWIGTNDRLHRWDGERFRVFGPEDGLTMERPQPTHMDSAGGVWVQGFRGLTAVFRGGRFVEEPGVGVLWPRLADRGARAWPGRDGTAWYSQYRPVSVTRWGLGGERTYDMRTANPRDGVTHILPVARDEAWVGLRQGGLRFIRGEEMVLVGAGSEFPEGPVQTMLLDREGNVWVGTSGGLTRIAAKSFAAVSGESGLSKERTWAVMEDPRGDVWVGSDLLLWRLHEGGVRSYDVGDGLPTLGFVSFAVDAAGTLWIGSTGGLAKFDGERFAGAGLVGENVRALYVDRGGRLWAGTTTSGVAVLEGGAVVRWYRASDGLASDWVRFIHQDRAGDMWLATTSGVSRLHDGAFTTFRVADGVADDRVLTIWEDPGGTLWMGTYRGGVSRYRDGKFVTVSTKHGLADDTIIQILPDDRGNLWMSSARGVFRVALAELDRVADGAAPSLSCVAYDKEDGLPTPDMGGGTQPAGWRARDGRLWFPTGRGPVVVDPAKVRVNPVAPTVIVERALYDRVHAGGAAFAKLPPGSKSLEIHYTATALSAPERTRFRYRLEPFEAEWVEAGTRRVAYYTSLTPGRYRFRVTAANESGVWNPVGAVYDLRVEPHFYETVPFYAGVVGLVGLAAWGAYQLRIRQLEARHAAVLAERGRIARELHDTVAQGFTGVSMQLEAVSARMGEAAGGAREHLDRARRLVRESLADARRSVRALRPQVLESQDLGASLRAVAAGLTDGVGIEARVESRASGRLPAEIEDALFRVGQEAMTNAVRHAGCRSLRVDLRVENRAATLVVEDDGSGFDPAKSVAGSGLAGMRERIEKLGGSVAVEGVEPNGTRVVATVPLT
jgi:signal transduction histidine kinase/ligand-binding sensor domain-containing protein